MQSSILKSSTTAQVNVEIPLVDNTDAQMNLDVTLVDDTSAPMEVDAPETIHVNPSYNRLKKIANFVKSILFKKNIDQPLTVEDLKMHAPDMEFNDDEANSVLLLYQFFSPYLLPKVYDDDVDRHPLLNFPLVTVCNHILRSTGNEKFVRRSVPVVRSFQDLFHYFGSNEIVFDSVLIERACWWNKRRKCATSTFIWIRCFSSQRSHNKQYYQVNQIPG
ncbi:uncharacterized protein BX664DRAFT_326656 [Halteromyces radiatus]|uniref:uncharacterized protein n=1 Tax=Halteromyces radiatus TaxID=101107 RepID=UPI00221FFFD0|nr:uncharacterized protein BX664DRAFT_326656 [Halteromyces radiatus]KAI8097548.1 hypothetical protein BX664DRAFT_326656 [Halteromyces radiatus]